ncbi:Protein CBG05189 [Caenorhabditis briggsae]|uniref:Uncharacterized protein n=3 Tax=Caenorhabditis briggsae TaxID=6238 RepID=A0AAE9EFC2_CAEBR|nr:Protein CBG05189 [Caenorhabditis briggsae]ULT99744.1 hypothetical protein L3Y34_000790 [Caenorhabditis briggsae]UMM22431.1 hypothetical protein L5515_003649 [Caenorhabditis briggsae]CAP25733.1 Protein CBG05189 [Caenorhabditis briggsae]
MGDGANVFNTFSFNKWADGKREEEIDKESRRRRAEQIKRLKERLRKERALREAQGDGDLDLDALIEAIQRGELINMPQQTDVVVTNLPDESSKRKRGVPDEFTDDYIFNEINLYANRSIGLNSAAEHVAAQDVPVNMQQLDPLSWRYNRRNQNNEMTPKNEAQPERRPNNFKFNRMIHEIPK